MEVPKEKLLELLELQKIDSTIDRLTHTRKSLPEQAELDVLQQRLHQLEATIGDHQALEEDAASRQKKLDNDIDLITQKIAAQEKKLNSGDVSSPRELASLQAEVESLKRRRSGLEDTDLEVMEEREKVATELRELESEATDLRSRITDVTARRDAALVDIDRQLLDARDERERWAPKFEAELMDLYDSLRKQKGGVGAAELKGDTCQGCHMKLPAQEVDRLRHTSGLLRCEECRRILVVV